MIQNVIYFNTLGISLMQFKFIKKCTVVMLAVFVPNQDSLKYLLYSAKKYKFLAIIPERNHIQQYSLWEL